MRKGPLLVFAAVLAVAALAALHSLTRPREVISSTPSAYTGPTVPLPLAAKAQACVGVVTFDTDSQIARFGATAPAGGAAPELVVTARADDGGYRYERRVAGGWTGQRQLDVPLIPPRSAVFGTLCIRNAGAHPIDLVGSLDGRAYSRPHVEIDGHSIETELQLRLLADGHHSVLSRLGRVTTHAATLKPFGGWWFWVLALALLAFTPIAVWKAIRAGLTEEEAASAGDRAPVGSWPELTRTRMRLASVPGWGWLAAGVVVAVIWCCYWAFSTHAFQNDEDQYVYLSRWMQHGFPGSALNFDVFGRGIQRLEIWLLAVPAALFDSPSSLQGGRLLNAIAFASTAIPVFLIARRLELGRAWAALPAVLSVFVPWAVVTTGFLTENVAYPAFAWVLWAILRTALVASWRNDLLALVLLVVAGMARSGLLILVPVLPIVVLAVGLRFDGGWRAVLRDHWLLWVAVAAGALGLLAGPLGIDPTGGLIHRLAGGYATQTEIDVGYLLAKSGRYLARVFVGTGFFPAAIALPWLALGLLGARDRARFAFSVLAVVAVVAMLYSLNTAGPDERYVLYFAPVVLLAAAAALARREIRPLGLAIASLLLLVLLARVPWNADQGAYGYFVSPVEMFYSRAVGQRLDRYLPGGPDAARLTATFALGLAGVVLAVLLRWHPRRLSGTVGVAVVTAIALTVPAQAQYAMSKYVNGAGAKAGPGMRERAFADTTVPNGATVGEFSEGVGRGAAFAGVWQEVQFYNQRIDSVFTLGPLQTAVPPGDRLVEGVSFDAGTGAIRSPEPLPDYLVVPGQIGTARVRGDVVAAPSYVPVFLIKVAKPARMEWSASGFGPDGAITGDNGRATVRFYGRGLQAGGAPYCASVLMIGPPEAAARFTFERDGRRIAGGGVDAGKASTFRFPLWDLPGRDSVEISVSGDPGLRVGGAGLVRGC
jgi:hypothetical protein